MKTYLVTVHNDNFKLDLEVEANNLKEASEVSKIRFYKKYKTFDNIRVKIQPQDIKNHINEIFTKIMEN